MKNQILTCMALLTISMTYAQEKNLLVSKLNPKSLTVILIPEDYHQALSPFKGRLPGEAVYNQLEDDLWEDWREAMMQTNFPPDFIRTLEELGQSKDFYPRYIVSLYFDKEGNILTGSVETSQEIYNELAPERIKIVLDNFISCRKIPSGVMSSIRVIMNHKEMKEEEFFELYDQRILKSDECLRKIEQRKMRNKSHNDHNKHYTYPVVKEKDKLRGGDYGVVMFSFNGSYPPDPLLYPDGKVNSYYSTGR